MTEQLTIDRQSPEAGRSENAFDEARAERFAERLMCALNEASLMLMTSIGHRTGLLDVLGAMKPATAEEIANAAGLAPRYVREWLGAMTTSGVVSYDPESRLYRLPAEHAAFLTRAASPNNFAVTSQFIALSGRMEEDIVAAFRTGDGVPYERYPRFHEVMAEDSAQTVVAALFDHILPLVPEMVERLQQGVDVLDVGCGAGRALRLMAERFPNSRFLGMDLCAEAFEGTEGEARRSGIENLSFEARDLSRIDRFGEFDLITAFDAVHDQRDPQGLLNAVARSLRPGGVFLMQDIGGSSRLEQNLEHPLGTFLYAVSTVHCTPVSLAQGGPGLGTMWGIELAEEMLTAAGFNEIRQEQLPHDPFNVYFVASRR